MYFRMLHMIVSFFAFVRTVRLWPLALRFLLSPICVTLALQNSRYMYCTVFDMYMY